MQKIQVQLWRENDRDYIEVWARNELETMVFSTDANKIDLSDSRQAIETKIDPVDYRKELKDRILDMICDKPAISFGELAKDDKIRNLINKIAKNPFNDFRVLDRALQSLRRAGDIEFTGKGWEIAY